MSRCAFFIVLMVWLPFIIVGQQRESNGFTDKPLRIEIKAYSDRETYRIIPCDSTGMILFFKSIELTSDNATRWYFIYYDQNLLQVWMKSAPIHSELTFNKVYRTHDTLNFYFEANKKAKNREINFQILRVVLRNGSLILNNGKTPGSSSMAFFQVDCDYAFLGLNSEGALAQIMVMNLPTGKVKLIPLLEGDQSSLISMTFNSSEKVLSALITKRLSKRNSELYLIRMKSDGTRISEIKLSNYSSDRRLTDMKEIMVSQNEALIAGSYIQSPKKKKSQKDKRTGIFSTHIGTNLQSPINFYNFLDLKNIRQLLSERDILSLRKKSMKKKRPDQEYSLDFSLLLHDIIHWKNQYLLVSETYFPQFHTESFTDYDFYGRPFTNSYSVFDGYRFTGAILTAFDGEGKLVWDNAMSIRNIITFSMEPKVSVYFFRDEIVLAYLSEGRIASRIIKGPEIMEKTSYSELELMSPNEKLLGESNSMMVHWYDEFFLCYGYQEIRDISKSGNDKRLVFFCNKVRFDR